MQCSRSSAAVGVAATSAVVTGIVLIIVTDALFTIFFNALGI
jgi:phospholipid/cholesterol/gamma-HCH transport system permease protein